MSDEAAGEPTAAPPPSPTPSPAPAPARETGDARVDEALARLDALGGAPVAAHVAVFEDVHQRLQELLVAADEEEGGPPVPRPPGPGTAPPRPGPPRGPFPGPRA
ncbi:hypothetical protein [Actinomadura kijaniata]|uniref:hypothetical protein n=1 Tax=Actinomadura kijaniata TaxID=46161 RepID=UPI000832EC5E|nr:hypothetical protein [Actinomadura kijaniata]